MNIKTEAANQSPIVPTQVLQSSAPLTVQLVDGPPTSGTIILFTTAERQLSEAAIQLDADNGGVISRALHNRKDAQKKHSVTHIYGAPGNFSAILVISLGKNGQAKGRFWRDLGGLIFSCLKHSEEATLVMVHPDGSAIEKHDALEVLRGVHLANYKVEDYKSKKSDDKSSERPQLALSVFAPQLDLQDLDLVLVEGLTHSVKITRDLITMPANKLNTDEFAQIVESYSSLGLDITILDEQQLATEKFDALLSVGRGSIKSSKVAIMHWRGSTEAPIAFVGKGVVFDSGGISLKPGVGMDEMKGDMGGAAIVVGTMVALASRRAAVNAVGIIGMVENMPDADALRPGDIITARSGKTIEVLNTDAEGRLVLADLLDYIEEKYSPHSIVDLATLTGAIIIALGKHYAGLFSNSDEFATELLSASDATFDRLWRMPLDEDYNKQIESKIADIKNIGGRAAGAITAAQFLQHFVKSDAKWAHIDVAGVAMSSPTTGTSSGWSSGFGVELLNQYAADVESGKASGK